MDLIDTPRPGENAHEYTVSEISGAVKRRLEAEFGRVRVRGEVGRVVRARSGHMYFDVKDDRNTLACTTWKGQISRLSVLPEEGMEVIVTGKMTAYGAQSKYNLNVDDVAVAGVGALMAMLEKRKTQLAAEGLFDPARKQPLPFLPDVIGVVTSPSGAVIRDILHRLRDRFPRKVLLWPVAVQGQVCAGQVAQAIAGFNALGQGGAMPRPDLLIVARGGGSIEDLWGFNEEIVARAAAASTIPLISAVGHETDTTLIDYVADRRAPTPTAAAEMAVPVRMELLAAVQGLGARGLAALNTVRGTRAQRLIDLARALPRPDMVLAAPRQRLDMWDGRLPLALRSVVDRQRVRVISHGARLRPEATMIHTRAGLLRQTAIRLAPSLARGVRGQRDRFAGLTRGLRADLVMRRSDQQRRGLHDLDQRLQRAMGQRLDAFTTRLTTLARLNETLGYKQTLARGYAVVRGQGGGVVTKRAEAKGQQALQIEFADGVLDVGGKPAVRKSKPVEKGGQGSLL